ncbi:response regulator [Micromonospora andamanensis]|nr:two-component system response regulator [Micromonospora andamanensis]
MTDLRQVEMGAGTLAPVRILVVDDDPGDVLMIEEALATSDVEKVIDVVGDGEEAMEFLRREGRHSDAQRPDVILLDLNMPRMDGRQVLGEVKSDEDLRTIPIVVLTTSNADTDIISSYTLQANAYVTKPIDLDDFNDVVHRIDEFFGRVVVLPKRA